MWFTGVDVEQETSVPPPKKNPGSAPANTSEKKKCLDAFATWYTAKPAYKN